MQVIEPIIQTLPAQPVQIIQPIKVVQPVAQPTTIVEVVKSRKKRRFTKLSKIAKLANRNKNIKNCLKITAIVAAIVFGLTAIIGLLMTGLLVFQHHLFYPRVAYTTTTKISQSVTLNIGQLCQWNNQCPANAYCLGTCHCSDNSYFDTTTGTCITSKFNNVLL